VNIAVAEAQLQKLGHDYKSTTHAEDALHLLDTAAFDLVLLGTQLPTMSGPEMTIAARQHKNPAVRNVWIISLSAGAVESDRETLLGAGMDDCLGKPLRLRDLSSTLHRFDRLAARPGKAGQRNWDSVMDLGALDGYREEAGKEGDQMLVGLMDIFIQNGQVALEDASHAAQLHDWNKLARVAHMLKGSASNFGAKSLQNACEWVETAASKQASTEVDRALAYLHFEFDLVKLAMDHAIVGMKQNAQT
jgi:CheY-like chemotaxis protein